jgi:plastocyanin
MLSRRWPAAVGAAAAGLLLASCTSTRPHTGSATASDVDGVATITIETGPDLRFHPSTITVHPGPVKLVLNNRVQGGAGPPHNLTFDDFPAGLVPTVRAGQQRAVTFTAPAPGSYRFVCTIHATQGQNGVMIVTKP